MKQDVVLRKRQDAPYTGIYDLMVVDSQLESTAGMETALIVSLFTDARASADNVATPQNRRGWVGNILTTNIGRSLGSVLWVYEQSRITQNILNQIKVAAQESLDWLVEDNIAKTVLVSIQEVRTRGIVIEINIQTPQGKNQRYSAIWRATSANNI